MDLESQKQIDANLDKCDKALADKPNLASIYNPQWREKFRKELLSKEDVSEVAYPSAYSIPIFEDLGLFPKCYQYRLEEAAGIFLPKLSTAQRNHLIARMRGDGCLSAEEELLLARGFALEFGSDAIVVPTGNGPIPEFTVNTNGYKIDIEAKGLLDSGRVRMLNETARQTGQNFWFSDESINDIERVKNAIVDKINKIDESKPCIIVFTQYTAWPDVRDSISLLRDIALNPLKPDYSIQQNKISLVIAYVFQRLLQGIWFNSSETARLNISQELRERLRRAVKNSFYPCPDGLFFIETMDDNTHNSLVNRMHG